MYVFFCGFSKKCCSKLFQWDKMVQNGVRAEVLIASVLVLVVLCGAEEVGEGVPVLLDPSVESGAWRVRELLDV